MASSVPSAMDFRCARWSTQDRDRSGFLPLLISLRDTASLLVGVGDGFEEFEVAVFPEVEDRGPEHVVYLSLPAPEALVLSLPDW